MKLTKLLAMLLALCMVLCCFAACGGDNKDDDKDEKTEATDEKKETEKETETETEADAELEGKWMMNVDLGKAITGMMEAEDVELELPSLEFGIEWDFADDGKFVATATEFPSKEDLAAFYKVFMKFTMDSMKDMLSEDELKEYLDMQGYDSWDAYIDEMVEQEMDGMDDMGELFEMLYGEYKLDKDVLTLTNEDFESEAVIKIKISGNEMTFVEVEDEFQTYTMFSGAKLIKK